MAQPLRFQNFFAMNEILNESIHTYNFEDSLDHNKYIF